MPLNRDLNYRINADPGGADRGFKSAETSASAFERELAKLEARQRRVDQASAQVGRGLLTAGAAIAAGLALATKAAIDWESAWAGVTKTVEGSPAQLAALEEELRGLATTLPATHSEIAGVAEAAGQLGVKREDIAEFTKTMIDLGVSTNLSADEAATGIARLANIMGTATSKSDNLGAAIVALGNDGASTEREILEMALRIAGAGRTIGLTEGEVLGFANALSSVGIEAEAGGTAISRTMITIENAVRSGGDRLEAFARVAGVSASEYARAYREDAAAGTIAFIQGLARMQAQGENVFPVLKELELGEVRVRDALLRASSAQDLFTGSVQLGNEAFDENTALLEEANKRYATTESRLRVARNQVNDFAIDLGNTLLPAVGKTADGVSALVGVVSDLPDPLKQGLALLGLVAAALTLTGGAALIAIPRIAAYRAAMETLRESTSRAQIGLARTASVLTGPWGLAVAGAVTALGFLISKKAESSRRTEELAATLDEETAAITDNTRAWVANELQSSGALDNAQALGLDLATVTDAALGEAAALREVNDAIAAANDAWDTALASTEAVTAADLEHRAGLKATAAQASDLAGELDGLNDGLDDAQAKARQAALAEGDLEKATDDLAPAQRDLADAFGLSAEQAEEASDAISELDDALKALFDSTFGLEAAEDALTRQLQQLEEQVREAKEAGDEHATSLTGNSEAALANRDAVRELIDAELRRIQELAEHTSSQEEVNAAVAEGRDRLREQLRELGFNEEEIGRYIGVLDEVQPIVNTTIGAVGLTEAQRAVAEFHRQLDDLPRHVAVRFEATGAIFGTGVFAGADGGLAGLPRYPHGGVVRGPGGPRDDRVLALVSAGEHIDNVASVRRNLAALQAGNAGARLAVVRDSGTPGAGGARAGSRPWGQYVENVNVTSVSSDFSTTQVLDDLAWRSGS